MVSVSLLRTLCFSALSGRPGEQGGPERGPEGPQARSWVPGGHVFALAPALRSPGALEATAACTGGVEGQEQRCLAGRRLPHELWTNSQGWRAKSLKNSPWVRI